MEPEGDRLERWKERTVRFGKWLGRMFSAAVTSLIISQTAKALVYPFMRKPWAFFDRQATSAAQAVGAA